MACRVPVDDAVARINRGADRIVELTEDELRSAMRIYFDDIHNVAEGAGAAGFAALLKEGAARAGAKAAVVLSGGNVDAPLFRDVLS
jgi:threonine dehydratase